MADDQVDKAVMPIPAPGNAPLTYGQVTSPENMPAKDGNTGGGSLGPYPVMDAGMTYREVGASGLRAFSGWVREEFLPALQGRQGMAKYREMIDNSPIVGAIKSAVEATMRKVEWRVTPANDSGEAVEKAEFIESCMEDMSDTWEDTVVEDLSMLWYGYAPKEIVYKKRLGRDPGMGPGGKQLGKSDYDDGFVGWRRLPLRGQDTVLKWFFDENGEIKGLTQQPYTGALLDLPIEKMLLFRPSQHKNNPEGRSILRSAYVPYYFIKRMQEQEAILGERLGGLPMVKVPSSLITAAAGTGPQAALAQQAIAAYKKMATNVRIDEQMGIMLPSDMWMGPTGLSDKPMYSFELVTPQGGRGSALNFDVSINRYNTSILTSVMADFLQMGHSARGAQNLGETKVDMFMQAIEGFLNSNAAIYNRHAIPRLWRLNGWDMDLMPQLEPDLATRIDLDALSNFVLRLSQSGMPLFPNEDLQSYLLDAGGLPDLVDENAMAAAGLNDEQIEIDLETSRTMLDQLQNPPEPANSNASGQRSPLQKMILASIARRMIRQAGPRFGVVTKKRPRRHRH